PTSHSFTAPPTSPIYSLSLHDALPIYSSFCGSLARAQLISRNATAWPVSHSLNPLQESSSFQCFGFATDWLSSSKNKSGWPAFKDRKSTRLNSSYLGISYAVFCLKKKK